LRYHHKYDSSKIKPLYDVAIVGTGLGALTSAVLLSKAGKKVILLEQHYRPGGFTHVFKRQKYEWDVGVHYVGQVNNPDAMMSKLFAKVTDEKLEWDDLGEVYDRLILAGKKFDFRKGADKLKQDMKLHFPEEHKAIDAYFSMLKDVNKYSGMFFGERTMPPLISRFFGWLLRKGYEPYCQQTTYEALKKFTDNEELIAVWCAQCGNYGLPPKKSSFAMHTTIVGHYMDGAAYPRGGAARIYDTMADIIVRNGGEIYVNARANKFITKKKKIKGIQMDDGSLVKAKNYISNAGLHNTYNHLLAESPLTEKYKTITNSIGASTSHICLYAGFTASDAEIGFPKYNNWVYNELDLENSYDRFFNNPKEAIPLYYISFPSAKDSSWSSRYPDRSTVQVVIPANYDWFKDWEGTSWKERPESYEAFKSSMEKRILHKLFELYPKAEKYLDHSELSTPLSTKHFSNYQHGEIYGLAHTTERFSQKWIRVYSPFKNLFLTGQDILTVGVGGALFSGAFAAFGILKLRMLKVLMSKK
jgi:all-trans-retinol 13,14-reductase